MTTDGTFEVWPGPMEGVASPAFVRAVNALDLVSVWMTPFIRLSSALPRKGKLAAFLAPFLESRKPVTAQLMGVDAKLLAECAEVCLDLGAVAINLNFGCPSRRVVNGGAGGGALRDPERAAEFLASVGVALPGVPLSVKMRAGFAEFAEIGTILPRLVETGAADKFFVHCRAVKEQYLPIPDRDARFSTVMRLGAGAKIVLNGDLADADDVRAVVRRTGCTGVMCARFWMRDPFLLRRIEGKTVPDAEEGKERFYRELLSAGVGGGALIELVRMLYGTSHPRFRELVGR